MMNVKLMMNFVSDDRKIKFENKDIMTYEFDN